MTAHPPPFQRQPETPAWLFASLAVSVGFSTHTTHQPSRTTEYEPFAVGPVFSQAKVPPVNAAM